MLDKHPNTDRHHGGSGSIHSDTAGVGCRSASQRLPRRDNNAPQPGKATILDPSQLSGGGEELDKHHTQDPWTKS